jgi:4-hydroxy-3-polyprenylbenzoate decarboxylase
VGLKYAGLKELILALEEMNQLRRIGVEVDPELEITEITHRTIKRGGPALLFEKVRGHNIPVLTNLFGSQERSGLVLGASDLNEIEKEIKKWAAPEIPTNWAEAAKFLPRLLELKDIFPKMVSRGSCQEVIKESGFFLESLPILKCWPDDGGRFITLPVVVTKNPATGVRNIGMYRLQAFDSQTTGMHWHQHKGAAQHYRIAEELNRPLEAAVAIGPAPAITYAATAPLPEDLDEYLLAGFLQKKRVELVKCLTVDLEVPANAQIVLEGYVNPKERRREGPFGDHTGFYSPVKDFPVFHITCVTHQKNPIYHAAVVGPPPMEDWFIGKATERIFLSLLKLNLPEIVDISLPCEGVFHNLLLVSIEKRYPGHARKVINALWGTGQLMFSKVIVVVDKEVDVQNPREVTWKALSSIDPQRDIIFTSGPVDDLDHASPMPGLGSKAGIDATRKWPEEGFSRPWPDEIKMTEDIKRMVDDKWEDFSI